ncbi:hypothetical protein Esti_003268 [Eimeria stiedai]
MMENRQQQQQQVASVCKVKVQHLSTKRGRGLVATEQIQSGEVSLQLAPLNQLQLATASYSSLQLAGTGRGGVAGGAVPLRAGTSIILLSGWKLWAQCIIYAEAEPLAAAEHEYSRLCGLTCSNCLCFVGSLKDTLRHILTRALDKMAQYPAGKVDAMLYSARLSAARTCWKRFVAHARRHHDGLALAGQCVAQVLFEVVYRNQELQAAMALYKRFHSAPCASSVRGVSELFHDFAFLSVAAQGTFSLVCLDVEFDHPLNSRLAKLLPKWRERLQQPSDKEEGGGHSQIAGSSSPPDEDAKETRMLIQVSRLLDEVSALTCGNNGALDAQEKEKGETKGGPEGGPLLPFLGWGLFFFGSMTNHSCWPNAESDFPLPRPSLEVRALRPIQEGEEVVLSYIDETLPLHERQRLLKENYNFSCTCARCVVEATEALLLLMKVPACSDKAQLEVLPLLVLVLLPLRCCCCCRCAAAAAAALLLLGTVYLHLEAASRLRFRSCYLVGQDCPLRSFLRGRNTGVSNTPDCNSSNSSSSSSRDSSPPPIVSPQLVTGL